MPDDDLYGEEHSSSALYILIAGLSFLLALGALTWGYFLQNRLSAAETRLAQSEERTEHLAAQQAEMWRQIHASDEELGAKVGITQRQIESRAQYILRQQQLANTRMARQEAVTRQKVTDVSHAVSNVQTAVGGVKQDVASTRQELASTEQQIHAVVGDMGVQSGLIATNADQLNYLKHLGDRNYMEFTLRKGQAPLAISPVKLQLRKADTKHSRYTLYIFSNDKRLEKKDRDLDEPLQFYTGNPPMLFEVVINRIEKNAVSGYLSAPKNMPKSFAP